MAAAAAVRPGASAVTLTTVGLATVAVAATGTILVDTAVELSAKAFTYRITMF
jgi:hypothetical protein